MDARQVFKLVNEELMPQYGTSMHWPYCLSSKCTGCLPPVRIIPQQLDLSIFRKD